jgi:hypothetical protein
MDDAARGRRQAIFSRIGLGGKREEAGILSQEWMMRPKEGGRQFSLGQDYGGRGSIFFPGMDDGGRGRSKCFQFFFNFYNLEQICSSNLEI